MTTKDKTGDQLMASIRKTKTEGATPDEKSAEPAQAAPATDEKAVTNGAPSVADTAVKRTRTTEKKVAARPKTTQTASDSTRTGYRSSGRVWPD